METTKKVQQAPSSPNRWSTKQYILLALAGTLAATVIVIAISALMSPAEVDFSITKASHVQSKENGQVNLTLAVAAANPGWRTDVEYRSFDVSLIYTPEHGDLTWINAKVRAPFRQPPRNTTTVTVLVGPVEGRYWEQFLEGKTNSTPISVQVTASVRFRVGMACTRSYRIAVLCKPGYELFQNDAISFNNTVGCSS